VENYVYSSPADLPVKVIDLGQNVSLANELPRARVKYRNVGGGTASFNANELELFIDAGGLADGLHSLPIEYSNKNSKIQVVAVEPAYAEVKLEAITTKEIALKTEVAGSPAPGYELRALKSQASRVTLSGAASAIAEISELTLKVTLDGNETADFSRKIILEPPPAWKLSGQAVSFEPAMVQVDVEIRKKQVAEPEQPVVGQDTLSPPADGQMTEAGMSRKTLMAKIVTDEELGGAAREILPENVLLTVEGESAVVETLNNESITLLIKNSEVKNGVYQVTSTDLLLPEGVDLKVTSISPAKISVRF
jgi:hypothetical protein